MSGVTDEGINQGKDPQELKQDCVYLDFQG